MVNPEILNMPGEPLFLTWRQVFLGKFAGFDFHKLKKSLLDLENRQKRRKYTPRVLTPDKREIMLNIV